MSYLTLIMLIFSVLGAMDRIFGNHFGIGKEFEKAFHFLGAMALSMIGMIIISPVIADIMKPFGLFLNNSFGIDASIVPASLFANDMGGATLAKEMMSDDKIGMYNALVVSSMMGCTISFTIPYALGVVNKDSRSWLLSGILCGVVTIPFGCIVSGVICGIDFGAMMINLMPLIILALLIAAGLGIFPEKCVRIFRVFAILITAIITVGLALGIVNFLSGKTVVHGIGTIEEGASVCVNAAIVLSGAFPLMYIISKVLSRPLKAVGKKTGLNEVSVVGFVSSIASSATTFGMMDKMGTKGIMMNSAFAVSGAFVMGSHLAFTMAFDGRYVASVIIGKLVSGICAVVFSNIVYNRIKNTEDNS